MKRLILSFALLAFLIPASKIKADSPLTSTLFSGAYSSHKVVKYTETPGKMDAVIAKFIWKKKKKLGEIGAVCAALGWDSEGSNNAELLLNWCKENKKGIHNWRDLPAHVMMAYGYLLALDDYFHPAPAEEVLRAAKEELPNSFTAHILHGLAAAQVAFESDWCEVWHIVERVDSDESLTRDLNEEAVGIIFEYMELYRSSCK